MKKAILPVALTAAAALGVSACAGAPAGQSSRSAQAVVDSKPVIVKPGFTTKGGTLNVLMSSDFQTLSDIGAA